MRSTSCINGMDCLKNARGTIMTRNACRNPWVNEVDLTIAQSLGWRFQNVQARFDIINFGNLLNKNWGRQRSRIRARPAARSAARRVALSRRATSCRRA